MLSAPHSPSLQLPFGGAGFDDFAPDAETVERLMQIYKPVPVAQKALGLSKHTIYKLIEEGDIAERVPSAGPNRSQNRQLKDKRNRRIGYKKFVRMADVWRLKYGQDWPREVLREFRLRESAASQQRRGIGSN